MSVATRYSGSVGLWRSTGRWALLALVLPVLSGCSSLSRVVWGTAHAYDGPERPMTEVATVHQGDRTFSVLEGIGGVVIDTVDQRSVPGPSDGKVVQVRILPGARQLTMRCLRSDAKPTTLSVQLEPRTLYDAECVKVAEGVYQPVLYRADFLAVHGRAMSPNIPPGVVIAFRAGGRHSASLEAQGLRPAPKARRGDVIVTETLEVPLPFRVIGEPGDMVEVRGASKQVWINGSAVDYKDLGTASDKFSGLPIATAPQVRRWRETLPGSRGHEIWLRPDRGAWSLTTLAFFKPTPECKVTDEVNVRCQVPEGKYFVLGDYRDDSRDSRMWGLADESKISGVVLPGNIGLATLK